MGPYAKVGQSKLLIGLARVTPLHGHQLQNVPARTSSLSGRTKEWIKEEHSRLNDHFFWASRSGINRLRDSCTRGSLDKFVRVSS